MSRKNTGTVGRKPVCSDSRKGLAPNRRHSALTDTPYSVRLKRAVGEWWIVEGPDEFYAERSCKQLAEEVADLLNTGYSVGRSRKQ